jgi:MFS superfamily sulfate permease-like transporter
MFLLVVTFTVTLVFGVDTGIFIGVGISLFMVVAHTTVPHLTVLGKNIEGHWTDASKDSSLEIDPSILVVRIEEALYFANIAMIKEMFRKIEVFGHMHAHPSSLAKSEGLGFQNIVVHCKNVTEIDASASAVVYEMVRDFENRGIFVCFVKIRPELFEVFGRAKIISGQDDLRVFNAIDDALLYIREFKGKGSMKF